MRALDYSRVFMFTQKMAGVENKFIRIEASGGEAVQLTAGHYIYANDGMKAAGEVHVGMCCGWVMGVRALWRRYLPTSGGCRARGCTTRRWCRAMLWSKACRRAPRCR